MKLRIKALRSLRSNYKRRGVWVWLKGRQISNCELCKGEREIRLGAALVPCFWCLGTGKEKGKRGYQRILSEPGNVLVEQERAAAGAAT